MGTSAVRISSRTRNGPSATLFRPPHIFTMAPVTVQVCLQACRRAGLPTPPHIAPAAVRSAAESLPKHLLQASILSHVRVVAVATRK
jgi:hypothetical protein